VRCDCSLGVSAVISALQALRILRAFRSDPVAYPGILFRGGGRSTNSVEDRGQRERESGSSSPLVRGSGSSCNLVQEISFYIVTFS